MRNIIILIIIGLFFSLNACKPDPKDEIIQYPINNEFKKYFGNFKKGTWWAYKDTVSGRIDTLKLTTYIKETTSNCYMKIDDKEVYSSIIYYKIEHNLTQGGKTWAFRVRSDCDAPETSFVDINFGTGSGVMLFFIDGKFLDYSSTSNGDSLLSTYYSSYSLNGTSYNDVYVVNNTGYQTSYSTYNYIISKNIGIIGFNAKDHNGFWKGYWMLTDKNIVL